MRPFRNHRRTDEKFTRMPPDLRAAHEANDRAVLAAYGLAPNTPEPEIVAHLFKLYAEKVKVKEL